MRRQGWAATAVGEIAREGSAPMGSFYHHFPGGKEQLGAAALDAGADAVGALIATALDGDGDLADRLTAVVVTVADRLDDSGFAHGCPVATTALETVATSELLQERSRAALSGWTGQICQAALADGLGADDAESLAVTAVALLEGAELLARVHRDRAPLDHAAGALRQLVESHRRTGDAG